MKKNLIAMAVAAAVSIPAVASAEDDIKVYGLAQVEVANIDPQAAGQDAAVSVLDNANGRVGVIATEDLGGGMQGIAKFEFRIDTADGSAANNGCDTFTSTSEKFDTNGDGTKDTDLVTSASCKSGAGVSLTGRELFVGLKGGFGQVELGRLKSAYKYAGGVTYDPFVATTLEAREGKVPAKGYGGGMSGGDFGQGGFLSNTIGYSSPKLGPVAVRVTYGPSEDDSSYTASVKGSFKMGEAFVAVADNGDLNKADYDYSAWKVGGQVRLAGGAHKISLQYEGTEYKPAGGGDSTKPTYIFAGYQGSFGKSTFVVQGGTKDSDQSGDKTEDTTYMAVGAIYNFSKTTRVFGGYANRDVDNDSGRSVISIGMRKDFK